MLVLKIDDKDRDKFLKNVSDASKDILLYEWESDKIVELEGHEKGFW